MMLGFLTAFVSPLRNLFARRVPRLSRDRTFIVTTLQDPRLDYTKADREDVQARARFFESGDGVFNKLCDIFEQYVCGSNGMPVMPASADAAFRAWALAYFEGWTRIPDLVSLASFGVLQGMIGRRWFVDGEVFILLTEGDTGPRLQLIEAHRVKTPPDLSKHEGTSIIDGVAIDANGRPTGYYVSTLGVNGKTTFALVPADSMIHHFEQSRPMQMRGEPFCAPVLDDMHHLRDLQGYEMMVAKNSAEIAHVLKTRTGEADLNALRRGLGSAAVVAGDGSVKTEDRAKAMRDAMGGTTIVLAKDEELEQFRSDRPTAGTQALWDFLTSKICAGVGISKLLVFPWSMQGTVVRFDVDSQASFFRSRASVMIDTNRRIFRFVIEWALKSGLYKGRVPDDWFSCDIRPPRSVNVDLGRASAALIQELQAGVTTLARAYADMGLDWRQELRQRAMEAAEIVALANEFKVSPESISNLVMTQLTV